MANPESSPVFIKASVQEWLDLSDADMAYIDMKVRLGIALREAREASELSQRALAAQLETDQARVARMESADKSVSTDALLRSLLSLGVSPQDIGGFISG